MKKITLFLFVFLIIYSAHAQTNALQNEDCIDQSISKEEAHKMMKTAAFSLMGPHFDTSLKNAIELAQNDPEAYVNGPATCFAPDTDPAVVEAFYRNRRFIENSLGIHGPNSRYNLASRWSSTAINGGGLGQGDITTLTWSYVPDNTVIGNGGCQLPDIGGNSNFIAFFNGIYGAPTTPGDYTTAPWHNVFISMFDSWSVASGLVFVYEPNDDGVTVVTGGSGIVGVRGDMRISGHPIDGNSGVLACNYYPENGDMIIDTADNFFVNNPTIGTTNVLTHEIGHGVGLRHVCPVNQTKLMEPFVNFAFVGPQEDDILATNRHYGDPEGVNDTPGTATLLGANANPTSYSRAQRSIDDDIDTDYFSFTVSESTELTGTLTPTGTTYLEGVQNSNGSCSSGSAFNALIISDLMLEVLDTDGVTVLAMAAANGAGVAETVTNVSLPLAGTYYVRVSQQGAVINSAQMYDLNFNLVAAIAGNDSPIAVCQNYIAELDATGNVTITGANVDGGSTDPDGDPLTLSVIPDTFSCIDIGTPQTVTLTVSDGNGGTDTCTATVTVEDNEDPVITCVANDNRDTEPGLCTYTVVGTEFDATFTDNCSNGSITNDLNNSDTVAGEVLPNGDTTVVWIVDDGNGQTATCTTVITVEDNEVPTITCIPDDNRDTNPGVCTYTVVGTEFDATFTDNCSLGSITNDLNNSDTVAGEVLPNGDTTVVWIVDDGNGQTATCTTVITVEDNEVPIITCVADDNRDTDPGVCTYTVVGTEFDTTFTDNCSLGSITNDLNNSDTVAGEVLPNGDTTVVWIVDDGNGQTATCTTVITVEDNEGPQIVCPPNETVNLDANGTYTLGDYIGDGTATVSDNCTDPVTIFSQDPAPGTLLGFGVQVITFTAEDEYGNVSTCSFELDVDQMLGTGETEDFASLLFYPNPADNKVNLSNPSQIELSDVIIYDLTGRIVNKVDLSNMGSEISIDVSTLANATYLLMIKGSQGTSTKTLIVNNY